jgi:hypothetical protein
MIYYLKKKEKENHLTEIEEGFFRSNENVLSLTTIFGRTKYR